MSLALLGALLIGICLGLLGSGGSIITVPVLVFMMKRPEKLAIAESLAIVGSIAFVGALSYMLRAQVQWKSVLYFGFPGMVGASLGGCCSYFSSGALQLTLFALLMLMVSGMMILDQSIFEKMIIRHPSIKYNVLGGVLVGYITGFIGIGGGFLIVPSLIVLCNISMPFAIGTSLVIIAMNAFTGFINQIFILNILHLPVDWTIITTFSCVGILGSLSGSLIANRVPQIYLRKAFGLSVFGMGCYILLSTSNFLT